MSREMFGTHRGKETVKAGKTGAPSPLSWPGAPSVQGKLTEETGSHFNLSGGQRLLLTCVLKAPTNQYNKNKSHNGQDLMASPIRTDRTQGLSELLPQASPSSSDRGPYTHCARSSPGPSPAPPCANNTGQSLLSGLSWKRVRVSGAAHLNLKPFLCSLCYGMTAWLFTESLVHCFFP